MTAKQGNKIGHFTIDPDKSDFIGKYIGTIIGGGGCIYN